MKTGRRLLLERCYLLAQFVECAAAIKDRTEAVRTFARRLQVLAFIVPASQAAGGIAATIEMFKRIRLLALGGIGTVGAVACATCALTCLKSANEHHFAPTKS
jgi:hypothetical protein